MTNEPNIYIGIEDLVKADGISIKLDIDPTNIDLQKEKDIHLAVILKIILQKNTESSKEQEDPLKDILFVTIDSADTLARLPVNYAINSPTPFEMQIYKKERIDRRKIAKNL